MARSIVFSVMVALSVGVVATQEREMVIEVEQLEDNLFVQFDMPVARRHWEAFCVQALWSETSSHLVLSRSSKVSLTSTRSGICVGRVSN